MSSSNSSSPLTSRQRGEIIESVLRIRHMTQQPSDFLTELLVQQQQFACIRWLAHFKIFDAIPLPPNAITYAALAKKTGLPASTIKPVARMAMTANFLGETHDGQLSHNPISCAIAESKDLSTWFSYLLNRSVPCMDSFIAATTKWPNATEANQTAYNLAFDTKLPFFDHLKANTDLGAEFGAYMKSQASAHEGASVEHLVRGYDWAKLGEAKVIDVGGGQADAAIALAQTYPLLSITTQDLAHSSTPALTKISSLAPSISSRLTFTTHDFFTPQPSHASPPDIFLLRMILHDWPNADVIRILRHVVAAMTPESRILIMDMVLPTPGVGARGFEAALRQKDLTMRQVLNAKEREMEDWVSLLGETDERLRVLGRRRPEGSQLEILEVGF